MPGKNGREMLDEIVSRADHPPVVFVTGNDDTAVAVEAIHAGASDFVVKTVGESFFDLLAGRFRQALARNALELEKRRMELDLRAANERLEMLIREVHHRVSNSLQMVLSFVGMQANQTEVAEARDILASTQNRIKAISKVHQNLYTRGDIQTMDLDEYLASLIAELRGSISEGSTAIAMTFAADPVEVSPDEAVSIGVVVNELVTNAAKYAFADRTEGTIAVSLTDEGEGSYTVTVADDGAGMGDAPEPQGTGLGMRIVAAISRSLDSELDRVPCENGTAQRLRVRKRQAASPAS
ncbi:response regulator [Qipengyuania sp. MTN3-11]